ncbi:hypothetical protein [Gordonia sp. ABSL49_1]|jgi:hypothetical protein|uniref:hypothetical protein n=1 Tax=Gordonia sp. ABSL49_1 TaxID=2920941 RepID=UPI001F0EC144|nr:hypothetical protein [Gordonia sp. ABSL49_1]MCH5644207.1 hypothetical protein [Gordonia sp. ABSL49_1]
MGKISRTAAAVTTAAIATVAIAAGGGAASAGTALVYQRDGFDVRIEGGPKQTVVFKFWNNADRGVTCGWTVAGVRQPDFVILRGTRQEHVAQAKTAGNHFVTYACHSDSGGILPPKYRFRGEGPVTVDKTVVPLAPTPKPKPKLKPGGPKPKFNPKAPLPKPKPKTPLEQLLETFGS